MDNEIFCLWMLGGKIVPSERYGYVEIYQRELYTHKR